MLLLSLLLHCRRRLEHPKLWISAIVVVVIIITVVAGTDVLATVVAVAVVVATTATAGWRLKVWLEVNVKRLTRQLNVCRKAHTHTQTL